MKIEIGLLGCLLNGTKKFGVIEKFSKTDMKGVTGVVDMMSVYSSTRLRMLQYPSNNNKG